jgi:haloalkane dehalogenase
MTTDAPLSKSFSTVDGKSMAYHTSGDGDPIIFLHGNPTSSYLWRNIIPHVDGLGHVVAPDLIGMGDSDKLEPSGPDRYTFVEHRSYLDHLLEQVIGDAGNVILIVHDWGSALGFDWANRHRGRIKGICYMEAIVMPLGWDDWPGASKQLFQAMRTSMGESMVLENNIFVEKVLPRSILRSLSDTEMAHYMRPFKKPGESRRPTLTWPRQIPLDGEPVDVDHIVKDYSRWMATNGVAKLFVNAEPGAILIGGQRDFCRGWANQTEVTVNGSHFIQEDSPDEIGGALADWIKGID